MGTEHASFPRMRTVLLVAALFSLPALATGERVLLTPGDSPLAQTLCVSMNCVTDGAHDVTIAAKEVKGAMQFTVSAATGQVKLVTTASFNAEGEVSSTDLVHATSLIVKVIEAAPAALKVKKESAKVASKNAKRKSLKLVANR